MPGQRILPADSSLTFLEYLNPRSTLAAPHPSPLASQLLNIDGVISVFYGSDYITVTKESQMNWAHVKPEILSLITEAVTSGAQIVNMSQAQRDSKDSANDQCDSLLFNEEDSEVVSMIKELMETRIRPAIQEDGGDIEFRGFENGNVLLKLRGACRTCDSSTVTLKNGIESMLMHYVSSTRTRCRSFLHDLWIWPGEDRGSKRSRSGVRSRRGDRDARVCQIWREIKTPEGEELFGDGRRLRQKICQHARNPKVTRRYVITGDLKSQGTRQHTSSIPFKRQTLRPTSGSIAVGKVRCRLSIKTKWRRPEVRKAYAVAGTLCCINEMQRAWLRLNISLRATAHLWLSRPSGHKVMNRRGSRACIPVV